MGSIVELNDTLRITKEQGFPAILDISVHLKKPFKLSDLEGQIFEFTAKEKVRVYQQSPIRNFLVEFLDGKWLYWGLCEVIAVHHDYESKMTSGKYKITRLNTPEEMKLAFDLIDTREEFNYFS